MNPFFAYLNRLKLIRRWGLMRNAIPENDMEHSMQCALIAHALAVLAKERHGKAIDPQAAATMALYHDAGEVLTGDLPTPVKYKNAEIMSAYKTIEKLANEQLIHMLPADLKPAYAPYLLPDKESYAWKLVKAADRIFTNDMLSLEVGQVPGQVRAARAAGARNLMFTVSLAADPERTVELFGREVLPVVSRD